MWCASPLRADEAGKAAKAEELLQLIQGDQMMKMLEPMATGMAGAIKPDLPAEERERISAMQKKIMALVADRINKAKPALAKVYTETYTEDELNGILAFYKSPVGKVFLQKMPEVMQRSAPIMMTLMTNLQPEIQKMAEEMKQGPK